MTVIPRRKPDGRRPPGGYRRPLTRGEKATMLVVAAWVGFVALALPVFSVGETIVASLSPAIGLAAGLWTGIGLGFGIVGQLGSASFIFPSVSGALLGAIAGCLSAWITRALPDEQGRVGRSFVSSLLSPELWQRNPAAFVCHLIVGTVIGIALMAGLSSVGFFDATTEVGRGAQVILGGGGGDPFGDTLISFLLALFRMLGALLVACAIVGLCVGGVLGGAIGAGFSMLGVSAVVGGASEGLAFRFFAPFRPQYLQSGRLIYFLVGAGIGAAQGMAVGFGTGAVLFLVQAISIFA